MYRQIKLGNMTETEAVGTGALSRVPRIEMSRLWQDFRGKALVKLGARQGSDIDGLVGHGHEFEFILPAVGRSERVLGRVMR